MPPASDELALVALGANLGDAARTVREAMAALGELAEGPVRGSALYGSEPQGCPVGDPPFVNAAVCFYPRPALQEPFALLRALRALELQFGRTAKRVLNEARVLDLDLIALGQRQLSTEELTLPHPRAHLRGFVLLPLSELVPDFVFPGRREAISTLALRPEIREGTHLYAT